MQAEETADPSTPLRSGRDDTLWGELSTRDARFFEPLRFGGDDKLWGVNYRPRPLDFLDVLGLHAHADEASGEVLEAGNLCDDAEREGWGDGAGALKGAGEDAVGEDLYSLCVSHGAFAVVLDSLQVVYGGAAGEDGFGEDVGGGDRVLEGYVDADAADRGHGVGCVADA